MVNAPSGRIINDFGPAGEKKDKKKKMFHKLNSLVNKEDKENIEHAKIKVGTVDRVFAKIRGFPSWPAQLLESAIKPDGNITVKFQNGSLGHKAEVMDFSHENFLKLIKSSKFKKSGSGSRAAFLKECGKWGLAMGL